MSTDVELGFIQEKMEVYIENLKQLEVLLLEEFDTLKSRDVSALNDCMKNKEKIVSFLETYDKENAELLTKANDIRDDSSIVFIKKRIENLINSCNKQNQINGAVVDISSQFNQRMINIMIGKNTGNNFYDPNGKSESDFSKNSVARI